MISRVSSALTLLVVFGVWLVGTPAHAIEYDAPLNVNDEQDLFDLEAEGVIDESDRETLVELIQTGVDLNTASRADLYALPGLSYAEVDAILEYRKLAGHIEDPGVLVQAGALTSEDLQEIAPFLLVVDRGQPLPVAGYAKFQTRVMNQDPVPPPLMLRTRLKLPLDFSAGFALLTNRFRLGQVTYDPLGARLQARSPAYGLTVPKAYVQWKATSRQVTLGTFDVGFGERLTLDTTTRRTPDGFYADYTVDSDFEPQQVCVGTAGGEACTVDNPNALRGTPDYDSDQSFRGLAGSIEDLELGKDATLSFHAFGSYQSRSIYQYQLFDKLACTDPREDIDDCTAPPLFITGTEERFRYATLPDVWDEIAGGGNATVSLGYATRFGVTGYGAAPQWRIQGASIDFQEWARYPWNGPFGAVGAFGSTKVGAFNLFAEGARSFDQLPGGGGGFGAIQRTVWSQKKHEAELSLRYFDRYFVNPYGGAFAAADKYEGQRARNEAGARLRYFNGMTKDWRFRASADVWTLPTDANGPGTQGQTSYDLRSRFDFVGFEWGTLSAWGVHGNKDLDRAGPGECYEYQVVEGEGDDTLCGGESYRVYGKAVVHPFGKRYRVGLSYGHKLVSDPRLAPEMRQDSATTLEVFALPTETIRVRARLRYLIEDLKDDAYLERSLWPWIEVSYRPARQMALKLRYDVYAYLDERQSTRDRQPNPEHRFRFELESRF